MLRFVVSRGLILVSVCVCVQFEPLEQVAVDIPFLLMTDILSSSPWPLLLSSSSLQLLTVTSSTPQLQSQLQQGTRAAQGDGLQGYSSYGYRADDAAFVCSVVLQTGESASECFCLRCPADTSSSNTVATGQYVVSWRRYVEHTHPEEHRCE